MLAGDLDQEVAVGCDQLLAAVLDLQLVKAIVHRGYYGLRIAWEGAGVLERPAFR